MTEKQVSFIIPHKGREQYLQQTLQSISEQDFDLEKIEVAVVTQNSELSPETKQFADKLELKTHFRPETDTISALRNFGVTQTSGTYLAFLDADIDLSPNWIRSLLEELHSDPQRVLVSAAQTCAADAPPLEQIRTSLSNAETDVNVNFLPGRNLLLSRETFNRSGGFPEHLVTCEDYYFTDQVHHLGDLYYSSSASYVHLGEDRDYAEMYRKEIWRGQSNFQSIRGRKIPMREIPSFVVPIGIFAMLLLFIVTLLSGYPLLAFISFSLFLTPVMAYSIRLNKLVQNRARLSDVIKFYLYYFPARAIGTLGGIFKTFTTSSHNS